MDGKETKTEISFGKLLELIAFITLVCTPVLFVLGHLSAYWYFSSFDIPYIEYTDTNTAFSFALNSIDVVLSVIALIFILIIGVTLMHFFTKDHEKVKNMTRGQQLLILFKLMPKIILLAVALLILGTFLGNVITSSDLKEQVKSKHYIPYEISYNKGTSKLSCVTSIGSIGQYQVFISQSFQTILIPEANIVSVKKMFAPVPIKELPDGRRTLTNPSYDKELKVWLNKWESDCPNEELESFKYFNFSTSGRNVVTR